jgi:thiol:disulfide interchange protein DsbA
MQTRLMSIFCALLLLSWSGLSPAQSGDKTYEYIRPVQPTQVAPGMIEVVEIFYYGCIHCYHFEPYLEKWLQDKPGNAEFRRMPAVFSKVQIPLAKAYYTAEKLGLLEKIHLPLFKAINDDRREIFTDETIKAFFAEQGVSAADFNRIYNSMEISTKVRQAEVMARNYRVPHTPALVVNGKYLTSPSMAGNYNNLEQLLDVLVQRESRGE